MPVRTADAQGRACLLVLPSDRPCTRQDALAAEAFLTRVFQDPAEAARLAAAWRQEVLLESCSAALLSLTVDYHPTPHVATLRPQRAAPEPVWFLGAAGGGGGSPCPGSSTGGTAAGAGSRVAVEGLKSSSAAAKAGSSRVAISQGGRQQRQGDGSLPMLRSLSRLADREQQQQCPPRSKSSLGTYACGAASAAPGDLAWDTFCATSVAAALAVCFAEAVRQVEVACAERGRLLARLWNSYTATLGALLEQQAAEAARLGEANAGLAAEVARLRWEVSTMDFLRREITRLRKDLQSAQFELDECRQERAALQEEAHAAEGELERLHLHLRRRLAQLRWRHATAVLGTHSRQGLLQSGVQAVLAGQRRQARAAAAAAAAEAKATDSGSPDDSAAPAAAQQAGAAGASGAGEQEGERAPSTGGLLVAQVEAVERAAAATVAAQQRRNQWRLHRQAEQLLQETAMAAASALPPAQRQQQQQVAPPAAPWARPRKSLLSQKQQSRLARSSMNPDALEGLPLGMAAVPAAPAASPLRNATAATGGGTPAGAGSAAPGAAGAPFSQLPPLAGVALLRALAPEARALMLSSLPAEQRQQLLVAMSDEERAGLLAVMDTPTQQQVLALLGPQAARRTTAALYGMPRIAARWLASMPGDKAMSAFTERLSAAQQTATLLAMLPAHAAALLLGLPEARRAELLAALPAEAAAALLAEVPPASAAALLAAAAADGAWLLGVLQGLPPKQRAALLAALEPAELGRLLRLPGLEARGVRWVLSLLPLAARAAVELADEEHHAEEAAREQRAAVVAAVDMDPALALLAHFESLSVPDKTTVLSLGAPASAAPLLAALPGPECAEVLLLLPGGRVRALLAALPPAAAQHVEPLLWSAAAVRGSILQPGGGAPAAGDAHEPAPAEPGALAPPRPDRGSREGPERAPSATRTASSPTPLPQRTRRLSSATSSGGSGGGAPRRRLSSVLSHSLARQLSK
eukprot:scaffold9.g3228.t1